MCVLFSIAAFCTFKDQQKLSAILFYVVVIILSLPACISLGHRSFAMLVAKIMICLGFLSFLPGIPYPTSAGLQWFKLPPFYLYCYIPTIGAAMDSYLHPSEPGYISTSIYNLAYGGRHFFEWLILKRLVVFFIFTAATLLLVFKKKIISFLEIAVGAKWACGCYIGGCTVIIVFFMLIMPYFTDDTRAGK